MDWEEELFRDTPRGLSDKADAVPRAQWATPSLGPMWNHSRSSIFLGYRDDKGVGCGDDRHVLLVAGSRAGKGVSYVIPNLLLYEGSVLAIDPKGELARETAKRRVAMGQKVIVSTRLSKLTPARRRQSTTPRSWRMPWWSMRAHTTSTGSMARASW
jgi:type IV secretion system protein VirD4